MLQRLAMFLFFCRPECVIYFSAAFFSTFSGFHSPACTRIALRFHIFFFRLHLHGYASIDMFSGVLVLAQTAVSSIHPPIELRAHASDCTAERAGVLLPVSQSRFAWGVALDQRARALQVFTTLFFACGFFCNCSASVLLSFCIRAVTLSGPRVVV